MSRGESKMHWPNQISGTIKSTRRILDKTGSLLKEMGTLYLSTLQYLFVKPKKVKTLLIIIKSPFYRQIYCTIWDQVCLVSKHVVDDDNPQEIGHKVGLTHVVLLKNHTTIS